MVLRKLDTCLQKNEAGVLPDTNMPKKKKSKWIKDLNIKAKTSFKTLRGTQKKKADKLGYIKTKKFCASKDIFIQEWKIHKIGKNICKSMYLIKGLKSRIFRELLKFQQ